MEIPEKLQGWLLRTGLVEQGRLPVRAAFRAMGASLPTFADVRRLTDAVVAALGDRGALEHDNGEQRWVYRRDPEDEAWLLAPALIDEQGWGPVGDVPEPPKDRVVPKGPDMHAGKLVLSAGASRMALAYDAVGMLSGYECGGGDPFATMWQGQTRPFVFDPSARPPSPPAYPLLLRDDLSEAGNPIEDLAQWIAALEPSADTAARLFAPDPLPLGSQAMLLRAKVSAAVLLWEGRVPHEARWLVQDGWCGRAFTSGATREAALSEIRAELWRVKPRLAGTPGGEELAWQMPDLEPSGPDAVRRLPRAPRSAEDGGAQKVFSTDLSISLPPFVSRHEWPKADPERTPLVLMRIPAPPVVPDAFARAGFRPMAVIGDGGVIAWVLRRDDRDGWTLVGSRVLDLVDVAELDAELDAAARAYEEDWRELMPDGWDAQAKPLLSRWTLWDAEKQARGKLRGGGGAAGAFHPVMLGPEAAWQVARVRV